MDDGEVSGKAAAPAPRAKRRPHVPADERRRQIIRAAQEAFSRTSLQGTSTREIAKAAQVNPATLFEHFGSKEALFREAVVTPMLEAMGELRGRMRVYHKTRSSAAADEMAKAGVYKQMEVMKKLFPLFTSALFSDLEAGQKLYKEHIVPQLLEREAMARGLATDETDPYFLELAALGLLFAIAMDETFTGGRLSRTEYAAQFVQLFTTGTARHAQASPHETSPASSMPLGRLRRLGHSELFVSPLGLGTLRFGTARGPSHDEARHIFDLYHQAQGNFIETTNPAGGNQPADDQPEDLIASLIRGRRDALVLASNHRLAPPGQSEGMAGHYRNRLILSVEQELDRLGTDYLDLLYINGLEEGVRVEEMLSACQDLIGQGKIRYAGMADIPAWQAARTQAIAEVRGWSPMVALRVRYSLAAREAERDLLVMAQEMGFGVTSRSPFEDAGFTAVPSPSAAIEAVARERGCTPSQVALAWKFQHPAVAALVIQPNSAAMLGECIDALDMTLNGDQIARLDAASSPDAGDAREA